MRHELVETTIGESARRRIAAGDADPSSMPADIVDDLTPAIVCVYCEGLWLEEQRAWVLAGLQCSALLRLVMR